MNGDTLREVIARAGWGDVAPAIAPPPVGRAVILDPMERLEGKLVRLADAADILAAEPELWAAFEKLVEAAQGNGNG